MGYETALFKVGPPKNGWINIYDGHEVGISWGCRCYAVAASRADIGKTLYRIRVIVKDRPDRRAGA